MKILLVILSLLLLYITGYTQDCETLYHNQFSLSNEGKIDEAIASAEKAYAECGKNNAFYKNSIFDLGDLYYQSKNYRKAKHFYKEVLPLLRLDTAEKEMVQYVTQKLALCYNSLGEFGNAISLCKKNAQEILQTKGYLNAEYINMISVIGLNYEMNNDFDSSLVFLQKALKYEKEFYGNDKNDSYANTLITYGRLLIKLNNRTDAEKELLNALYILQKSSNAASISGQNLIYSTLSSMYFEMGKVHQAEESYIKGLTLLKTAFSSTNENVLNAMNSLGTFYAKVNRFSASDSVYTKLIYLSASTGDSTGTASYLSHYSNLLCQNGRYIDAERAETRASRIYEETEGISSLNLLSSQLFLCGIYSSTNNQKYIQLVEKILNFWDKNSSQIENRPLKTLLFMTFANYFESRNDLQRAEGYYIKNMEIFKDHPPNLKLPAMIEMAIFYDQIGNRDKAKQRYIEAKEILIHNNMDFTAPAWALAEILRKEGNFIESKKLEQEVIDYLLSLHIPSTKLSSAYVRLADINLAMKENAEANKNFKSAFRILEENDLTKTKVYYYALSRYAAFNNNSGNVEEAGKIYKKIYEYHKSIGNDYQYAKSYYNYGYFKNTNQKIGSPLDIDFIQSIDVMEKTFGVTSSEIGIFYPSIAFNYISAGLESKAKEFYEKNYIYHKSQLSNKFQFLSEVEKINYLELLQDGFNLTLTFSYTDSAIRKHLSSFLYDEILLFKGAVLNNISSVQREVAKSNNVTIKGIWDTYIQVKKNIVEVSKNVKNFDELTQLEAEAEKLEKVITSKVDVTKFISKTARWNDIKKVLKKNELAIETYAFPYPSANGTKSIMYCALVIGADYEVPQFISLFSEEQLATLVNTEKGTDSVVYNDMYDYRKKGNDISKLIWQPLKLFLVGIDEVYVSSSGLLHQINLGALPLNANETFQAKYTFHNVTSTAEILNSSSIKSGEINTIFAFGGVDYDKANYTKKTVSTSQNTESSTSFVLTRSGNTKWPYLPATLEESKIISNLCTAKGITSKLSTGKDATETDLKNVSGSKEKYILHLATHGYFYPNQQNSELESTNIRTTTQNRNYAQSTNPLMRSGLIFSGANKSWLNDHKELDGQEDGILTAYEISSLDFRNCALAVLSACNTGLGKIRGSEGVFGLQRAFKMAGAKNILMSLWQVPDKETRELMQLFYTNFLNGMTLSESLKQAQIEMSKKHSPYYWAAFILLE